MFKKFLKISGIILLVAFISVFIRGYKYHETKTSKKDNPIVDSISNKKQDLIDEDIITSLLDDNIEQKEEQNPDNSISDLKSSEDNLIESKEQINSSDVDIKKTNSTTTNNKTPNNKSSNSSNNTTNNKIPSNNSSNNSNTNTIKIPPKAEVKSDTELWNEFINDPDTIRLLWGYVTKFTNPSHAENKSNELANLGYIPEWIETCTDLSTGKRCAYGVKAIIPSGTCENNPQMKYEWWKYDSNVDIITYLKSQGYACEGKTW